MSLNSSFSEMARPSDAAVGNSSSSSMLSRSEHDDLRTAFRLFDTENQGSIAVGELTVVLQELLADDATGSSEKEESADADGNTATSSSYSPTSSSSLNLQCLLASLEHMPAERRLSLEEFISLMTTPHPSDARDEWEKVFDLFSCGKGYIELEDLQKVAHDLGESSMEEEELRAMIDRVAPTTGRVTLEQFKDIMNKKLFS